MINAIFFDIPSKSIKGKIHKVRFLPDKNKYLCDCWPYITKGNCSHIEEAKKQNEIYNWI